MVAFIFLLAYLQAASSGSACATFAEGGDGHLQFNNGYFPQVCNQGQQYAHTIQYEKEFCSPPQILISHRRQGRDQYASFSFKIVSITKIDFQVSVRCDSAAEFRYYFFDWKAIIDSRIFVFNDFMQSITLIDGYRTPLIPYPIQDAVFEISWTITSFKAGNPKFTVEKQANGFNLCVTGVDSTQLSGLGVQIVAGLKDIFYLWDSTQVFELETYGIFQKALNQEFLPTQVRIITQSNMNEETIDSEIKIIDWNHLFWSIKQVPDTKNIIYANIFVINFKFQPHYYSKIRVSHLMCLDYKIIYGFKTQKVYFKEVDKTWSDSNIVSIPKIDYQKESIQLIYSHQCQPNRKIIVTILRNEKQEEYFYTYSQYCHRLYNLITMYIQLYQSRIGPSELLFSLSDQGVKLQQTMKDTGDTYQVLNIQIA